MARNNPIVGSKVKLEYVSPNDPTNPRYRLECNEKLRQREEERERLRKSFLVHGKTKQIVVK